MTKKKGRKLFLVLASSWTGIAQNWVIVIVLQSYNQLNREKLEN